MNIHKPSQMSLLHRTLEFRGRQGLSISAIVGLGIDGSPCLHEQSVWRLLQAQVEGGLVDEGIAKTRPEFLVAGRAHAPVPGLNEVTVQASLAGRSKRVMAFAPRHWVGGEARLAGPFEPVPLQWRHAYGGADFALNPQGTGRDPVNGVRWLPRLELPHSRIGAPTDVREPAGFGPLDLMHPQRAALRGTYDENYLKQHAPGFPPDVDWAYFNMAPRDQWIDGPLRGDEPFALENLHPARALIQGQLPSLKARVFARYQPLPGDVEDVDAEAADGKLREIAMRLTTVWFFPEAERMVLVWHGLAEIADEDAADVAHLMLALERLDAPKEDAHYLDVLARRLDPDMGGIESLNDAALLPEGLDVADPDFEREMAPFQMEGLQAQAQRRRAEIDVALAREQLRAEGKDPDALGIRLPEPEAPPKMADWPTYLKAKRKEMEKQQWEMVETVIDELGKLLATDPEVMAERAAQVHRGPPAYSAQAHLGEMRATGMPLPMPEDELLRKLRQREGMDRMDYWQSAHTQPPAFPLTGEAGAARRKEMQLLIEHDCRVLPGMDLTGVDLSGLDLRGFDFSGAWMESVNLGTSNVSGCNFSGAVLAHADLRGCIAIGADFSAANLGGAQLAGAVLDQSELGAAVLMRSALAESSLRGARVAGANLIESTWGPADWTGAHLAGNTFYQLDMRGLVLAEADLSGANFVECNLAGVDFSGALLEKANFITCDLRGARMEGARASGVVFVKDTVLDGLDAPRADFSQSNWGACSAVRARLGQARLEGANLSMADFGQADLARASFKGALLRKTRLSHASLVGANGHDAILSLANLSATDLRQASLFGADLSRVVLSGDTLFEGTDMQRARTWPRLSPAQQAVQARRDAALQARKERP